MMTEQQQKQYETQGKLQVSQQDFKEAEKRIADMKAKTDKGHIMSTEEELDMIDNIFGTKTPL